MTNTVFYVLQRWQHRFSILVLSAFRTVCLPAMGTKLSTFNFNEIRVSLLIRFKLSSMCVMGNVN